MFKNAFWYIIQGMCTALLHLIKGIPHRFETHEMCNEAVEEDPWALKYFPDEYKTRGMCTEAVDRVP